WLTSSYYASQLPAYAADLNNHDASDRFAGSTWQCLLPDSAYAACLPILDTKGRELFGLGPAFPHHLPGHASKPQKQYYEALQASPFGDDITFEMVDRLLTAEHLGAGPAVDLLCLSLSSFDIAGHAFGPDSPEMMDFTLRTDRQIAAFLKMLDGRVGRDRYLVVLTADHGAATPPPIAARAGFDAGYIDLADLKARLNTAFREEFGSLPDDAGYVRDIELPWVFFNPVVDQMDRPQRAKLFDTALAVIRRTPGLVNGFTADELSGPPPSPADLPRWLAWRSYYP